MLTSRFLFMFIHSVQNYKPIKFCMCSCPNGEWRLQKTLPIISRRTFQKESLPNKHWKSGAMKKPVYWWIRAGCSLPLQKKEKLRSRCQQNHLTVVNFSEILQETDYFWLMVRVLVECTDWHFEMVVSVCQGLKFLRWISSGVNQL